MTGSVPGVTEKAPPVFSRVISETTRSAVADASLEMAKVNVRLVLTVRVPKS